MSLIVKINYGIAIGVVLLGFVASYITYERNVPPAEMPQAVAPKEIVEADVPQPPELPPAVLKQAQATAQISKPSSQIGDWAYECKLSLEAMEECSALRRVLWQDDQSEALVVIVSMVRRGTEGKAVTATPRLKLVAPLGSFLPGGLSMRIDAEEPFIVPFQACAVDGCFVNLDLAPDVVEVMSKQGVMAVEYMTPDQKIATVKISLVGFPDVLKRVSE